MRRISFAVLALLVTLRASGAIDQPPPSGYSGLEAEEDFPADESLLTTMRSHGDLGAERTHMWRVFSSLIQTPLRDGVPLFMTWFGAGEVFAAETPHLEPTRLIGRALTLPHLRANDSSAQADAPLIIRAQYNWTAYRHIRDHHLNDLQQLASFSASRGRDVRSEGGIPAFPRASVVIKTAWWPVPAEGLVALPVWDPAIDRARRSGNDYFSWSRVVAVSQANTRAGSSNVELVGKIFSNVRSIGIDAFYHLILDEKLAQQLNADPSARKAAVMLMGRPLKSRDALVLVAMHVATRELTDWVWGTFWWHDLPTSGESAALRPGSISAPFCNYLMSVSFDPELPHEADGTPHIAFNPYLEGRLADHGSGGGTVSNCVACHLRASTALSSPFEVNRGSPSANSYSNLQRQKSTSLLWSLAIQAH